MAFIPTANTAKVCMRFSKAGQRVCNIFHVDLGVPPTNALLADVAGAFIDWWNDNLRHNSTAALVLEAVEVTDISVDGGIGIIETQGLPIAGDAAGGQLPNNVALAVGLVTGLTGRSHRGRSFFGGVDENSLDSTRQALTAGALAALQATFEALITSIVTLGWNLVITSLVSGGAPRAAGLNTPVTGVLVDKTLDSQRRRLPGRGV